MPQCILQISDDPNVIDGGGSYGRTHGAQACSRQELPLRRRAAARPEERWTRKKGSTVC